MARSVDLTQFAEIVRRLATLSGKDLRGVMVAEAGKILETAVRYTPKAEKAKIQQQVIRDAQLKFKNGKSDAGHIYTTKKGTVWFSPDHGEHWFRLSSWHVPPAVWQQYLRALSRDKDDLTKTIDRRVRERLARRGLTAKTWVQLGASLGVNVKAPGFVQNAAIPPGIAHGEFEANGKDATLTGSNASGVLIRTRTGQGIIDRAVRARLRFLETAIRKGALDTLQNRTKSFPHLFRDAPAA